MALVALASVLFVMHAPLAHSTPAPNMHMEPGSIKVDRQPGKTFTIDVLIDGVTNLGAFEFQIRSEPNLVRPIKVNVGPFLGSTTRTVACQTILEDARAGLGCTTQGESPPGPTGGGVVASVTYEVDGLFSGESALLLQNCGAADTLGTSLLIQACKDSKLEVNPPTATPTYTPSPTATRSDLFNLKLPQIQNLFLTTQDPVKLAPRTCQESTDTAVYTHEMSRQPNSISPKGEKQKVAAFEFEVRFDQKYVCVNLEPGQYATDVGMTCFVLDKDSSQLEGIARIGCAFKGKDLPKSDALELARIVVRPMPEVYHLIMPNQDNRLSVQIINQDCELADTQGHPIPKTGCDDSDLSLRFLEGDVVSDCRVDVLDQQQLASRWLATVGNGLYIERMDLEPSAVQPGMGNGDGAIDIKDIQFVFGRHGSTCADPHPDQPPTHSKGLPTLTPTQTPSATLTPHLTPTSTGTPKPRLKKLPHEAELLLTSPPPSGECEDSTDFATFSFVIKDPIVSPDPKEPGELQQLGAFEFETRFDPTAVCVDIVAGNIPQGEMSCLRYFGQGVANFGCLTTSKANPPQPQPPGTLATVIVRPQPELYTLLTPGGPPLVVDIINRECDLGDLQGHDIPNWDCGDARITIHNP
jgi:hypothetical protein